MKHVLVFDTETYGNYFLAAYRDVDSGQTWSFEVSEHNVSDLKPMWSLLAKSTIVTFNGRNFDMPVLGALMAGCSPAEIKRVANAIIERNLRPWDVEREFGFDIPTRIDHVDLFDVAPGTASLKIYGGRLHCQRMQDLPYPHDAELSQNEMEVVRLYCLNDLETTVQLYRALLPQLNLRTDMGRLYELDVRSKSDAQIAEAVICTAVSRQLGTDVKRPSIPTGTRYRYQAPGWLQFTTPALQEVFATVLRQDFVISNKGAVEMPEVFKDLLIPVGAGRYQLGIGGLHSTEKSVAHRAGDDFLLVDRDVASYYPAIILRCGFEPPHMGEAFTATFRQILARRLEAKRAGDKVTADSLKICVNGSFGKFGSMWSKMYAPDLMMQTTVTGQLALLMLIESFEAHGIPVVSANTDGVVAKCPRALVDLMSLLVWEWELATGFETEATEYAALYAKDVNNYIALKRDGGVKLKGLYAPAGLQKNPTNEVCVAAAVAHLVKGTPVEDTIRACADVRKFVTVRSVKGGAVYDGQYLGKAVRWYYGTSSRGAIHYKSNGYTVARSEGAVPCMELPAALPADINYDWYIAEAKSILEDVGA